jgi:thymidylate kinase
MKKNQKYFIFDEGSVHAAHNLFVHANSSPRRSDIVFFAHQIPKPDLIIYVKTPVEIMVSRTLQRGHHRVGNIEHDIRKFVANAVSSFEILASLDVIKERLIIVQNADSNFSQIDKIAKSIAKQILNHKQCFS